MSKRPSARTRKRASTTPRSTSVPESDVDRICLPTECTLAEVHDLKSKLAARLKTERPVCVDVSGVRRIDTASLQLLAAYARDRHADRLAFDLRGESAAFEEGVRLLGLRGLFDRPSLAQA